MDDDWDSLAPAAEPAQTPASEPVTFGDDDDFLGGGGGGDAAVVSPVAEPAAESQAVVVDDGGFDMGFGEATPVADPSPSGGGDLVGGGGDLVGGDGLMGDDLMGGFDAAPTPAPDAPKSGGKKGGKPKDSMFTKAPIVDTCDSSIIDEWEANHRKELKTKRDESTKKKLAALKEGEELLDKFFAERKVQLETNRKNNRTEEDQFISDRDAALKKGLNGKESWEKVCSYVDLAADPKRKSNVQRMRSIYIAVKSTPPSTIKNFGAGSAGL
eukprot:CAMPEP_0206269360 /NCGR_PEP_ID=MMETSP0047_2-20121206/32241_1 /ASSEMBLY_ACC=CAM_ASM_000192 /TAXON_ID=195065 /ORGANISM="Chroomonas mesostigmatica_cf, Strain CCMP1168" /LENGTH=269 /DNA_ID=CAMNT_0053697825 /DNA_START=6 /DNA_END=815 /DNA_ORIENTATION=-